jgi:hypothetical protein
VGARDVHRPCSRSRSGAGATRNWRAGVVAVAVALAACYQPRHDDGALDDGAALPLDPFVPDASVDAGGCAKVSSLSRLRIVVRTSSAGGNFAPRNVGAIWIETDAGAYVKTVERWGVARAKWLTRWLAASGGDVTDAITGATLKSHIVHDVAWNLTGRDGCEVPGGAYQVVLELTDRDGDGVSLAVPFAKGDTPEVRTPGDNPSFHQLELRLE